MNEDRYTTIKAGTLVLVTHQTSDDYRPLTLARAVSDLDLVALREIHAATMPEAEREWRDRGGDVFLRWLIAAGWLREVVTTELWIDSAWSDDEPTRDRVTEWPTAPEAHWWRHGAPYMDDVTPDPKARLEPERA